MIIRTFGTIKMGKKTSKDLSNGFSRWPVSALGLRHRPATGRYFHLKKTNTAFRTINFFIHTEKRKRVARNIQLHYHFE